MKKQPEERTTQIIDIIYKYSKQNIPFIKSLFKYLE